MKNAIAIWLLLFCLGLVSFNFSSPQDGAEIYKTKCAICHGAKVGEAPKLEALQLLSSKAIIKSLESGVMKMQGATLSKTEKKLVAAFISKVSKTSKNIVSKGVCRVEDSDNFGKGVSKAEKPQVASWGMGLTNQRFLNSNVSINAQNVGNLKLQWAFAFPEASRARVQPTIAGNTLFTASQQGVIYALDIRSGCIKWTFQADDEVRSALVIDTDKNGNANRLYFGDFKANVYAFDLISKKLLWKKHVDNHAQATITGSLTVYKNRLYVPVSSTEIVAAYSPQYPCCTFRGSVVALNALDGQQIWKTYTTDEPKPLSKNKVGTQNYGPSGAPIWSTPTIDTKRQLLYVGTGENYSRPASATSDAIIAMSLETGAIKWVNQTLAQDAWNAACLNPKDDANCPENKGPDFDFGCPPILIYGKNKPDLLLAGQKSGIVYAFDPDANGKIVWQKRIGRGGIMGGVHWGMASDDETLYVPINDREAYAADKDKPAQSGLHAVNIADGAVLWSLIEPNRCGDATWSCGPGLSAAITLLPDLVIGGTLDGLIHAYSRKDGKVLWEYDTKRDFETVNGHKGFGGTIDSPGAVVVGNQLFINSGYAKFGEKAGNVLLCFQLNLK